MENYNELQTKLEWLMENKRRDILSAIGRLTSQLNYVEKRLDMCKMGFTMHLLILLILVIIEKIFAFLISIGNAFVTNAFGLIYLIMGVFYFLAVLYLSVKTWNTFVIWLENFCTKWGDYYCRRKNIFTLSMEKLECLRQLIKYQNYIKVLEEIEEDKYRKEKSIDEWIATVQNMQLEQEVPIGRTEPEKREKVLFFVIFLIICLLMLHSL